MQHVVLDPWPAYATTCCIIQAMAFGFLSLLLPWPWRPRRDLDGLPQSALRKLPMSLQCVCGVRLSGWRHSGGVRECRRSASQHAHGRRRSPPNARIFPPQHCVAPALSPTVCTPELQVFPTYGQPRARPPGQARAMRSSLMPMRFAPHRSAA